MLLCILCFCACTPPKFTFEQEGVSALDFGNGKWILNYPVSSDDANDYYSYAQKHWRELIKDSLYTLHDLRVTYLVPEKIAFAPRPKTLRDIGLGTNCDYLINTKVDILNQELDGITNGIKPDYGTAIRTNEAQVEICIYDLRSGLLLSSRKATGIVKEQVHSDKDNGINFALDPEGIARNGIWEIVRYYKDNKNRHR